MIQAGALLRNKEILIGEEAINTIEVENEQLKAIIEIMKVEME
jgi:hypothetical protein